MARRPRRRVVLEIDTSSPSGRGIDDFRADYDQLPEDTKAFLELPEQFERFTRSRSRRYGGHRSASSRREKPDAELQAIDGMKRKNPELSDKAAARKYLHLHASERWLAAGNSERERMILNLTRRVSRSRHRNKLASGTK